MFKTGTMNIILNLHVHFKNSKNLPLNLHLFYLSRNSNIRDALGKQTTESI